MKKKCVSLLLCCAILCACMSVLADNPSVTGKVSEVEKYGHARLDVTIEAFTAAAENYLTAHGMDAEALKTLKEKLQ